MLPGLAFPAESINLKCMAGGGIVEFAPNGLLHGFDFRREKLHRLAAGCANHMVVAAPVEQLLIAGNTVSEGDLGGESTLGEELERAIDGCEADLRILFFNQAVQFLSGNVVAHAEKNLKNGVPLRTLLQSHSDEMLTQQATSLLKLLVVLFLVINAFFEHRLDILLQKVRKFRVFTVNHRRTQRRSFAENEETHSAGARPKLPCPVYRNE